MRARRSLRYARLPGAARERGVASASSAAGIIAGLRAGAYWGLGTGAGSGFAALYVLAALGMTAVGVVGWCLPAVRDLDRRLPDFDAAATEMAPPAADDATGPARPALAKGGAS
jgi:hypothetical protein